MTARVSIADSAPYFVRGAFIGTKYFGLGLKPVSGIWTDIEVSTNLPSWMYLATFLSTNQAKVFVDDEPVAASRFYRLKFPGTSVEEVQTAWQARHLQTYSFKLKRITWSVHLVATITVVDGIKTVSDVTDLITGEKQEQFDPNDFPDIDGLFEFLAQAGADGVWDGQVWYDRVQHLPVRSSIRRISGLNDQLTQFFISDFAPAK